MLLIHSVKVHWCYSGPWKVTVTRQKAEGALQRETKSPASQTWTGLTPSSGLYYTLIMTGIKETPPADVNVSLMTFKGSFNAYFTVTCGCFEHACSLKQHVLVYRMCSDRSLCFLVAFRESHVCVLTCRSVTGSGSVETTVEIQVMTSMISAHRKWWWIVSWSDMRAFSDEGEIDHLFRATIMTLTLCVLRFCLYFAVTVDLRSPLSPVCLP